MCIWNMVPDPFNCDTLHHAATRCNTLQHTAPHT